MALAEPLVRPRRQQLASDTQFARGGFTDAIQLDDRIRIEDEDLSGGVECVLYDRALDGDLVAWRALVNTGRIFYIPDDLIQESQLAHSEREQETWSQFAPPLGAARDSIKKKLDTLVADAVATWVRQHAVSAEQSALILDIPATLQEVRVKAGLPVQDVAAMFGVKRRQFYNLLNGEDLPSPDTDRRIGPVTEAIRVLSEAASGDSRAVRVAILARIGGESVFDAAMSGEPGRLESATARAAQAVASGQRLRKRLPPSHEATPEEAATARDELRYSRDQMGFNADGS